MTNILDKISTDFNDRFNRLKEDLEAMKDWKVLNRVLNLSDMSCFKLFKRTNDSLEDVGYLYSMLINGLLDDSSLMIEVYGSGDFTNLYIDWGNDDESSVSENDLSNILDILEERDEFLLNHEESCLSTFEDEDYKAFCQLMSFDEKLEQLMFELASKNIQELFKERKLKKS